MKIDTFLVALALSSTCTLCTLPSYTLSDTTLAKQYLEEAKALIASTKYDAALEKLDTAEVIYRRALGEDDLHIANVLQQKGWCSFYKSDYDRAIEYHQKTLEIQLKKLSAEHPMVERSYENLAIVYVNKGDFDRSDEYSKKVLEINLTRINAEHPCEAGTYIKLGTVYYNQFDCERAIECYQKALEIQLKKLGYEHPDVANSYIKLGSAYNLKGDYDCAIEFFKKDLEIQFKIVGYKHSNVADSYIKLGNAYNSKGDYDGAIQYYQKALEIYLKIFGYKHPKVADSYLELGKANEYKGEYEGAIQYYQKTLEIRLKIYGREDFWVAYSYKNLGNAYFAKGDYDRAIQYYQKTLEIRLKIYGREDLWVAYSYNNLGDAYNGKGDFDRANECHKKALKIKLRKLVSNRTSRAHTYNELGGDYSSKGEYELAIEYHLKALEIGLKKLGFEHTNVAYFYDNLGSNYRNKGDYNHAIEYHLKALEIRLKESDTDDPSVSYSYDNLGLDYAGKGDYDCAIEYHEKALEIRVKKFDTVDYWVAYYYNQLGHDYGGKGDYDCAIEYSKKALEIYLTKFDSGHYGKAQTHINHGKAQSYINLGNANNDKGDYDCAIEYHLKALEIKLKYQGAKHIDVANSYRDLGEICKSKSNYTCSAEYFKKALLSITSYRKNLENPSSKSTLVQKSVRVYEGGIASNFLLHQLTDSLHYLYESFTYAEQSKALSLYESMKNTEALHLAGIPDSLLQKEYDLRVDIAFYEKRRQERYAEGKEETDTTVMKISSKLFELNRSYESLILTFETEYPDYYRLKYDFHTENVSDIQHDLLQPNQALLEYFVGDSSVFIFLVKKDDYRVIEVKKDFPLEDWARKLRQSISGYYTDTLQIGDLYESTAHEYAEAAQLIYEKLLAPVDSLLPQRVVIVPDGVLGYVPFEALLTQKPTWWKLFETYSYFGLKHDVSYCYSATLLREMITRQHRNQPANMFLAMAPKFDGDTSLLMALGIDPSIPANKLPSLKYACEEALELGQLMDGTALVSKDATEDAFAKTAGQYGIVHLSTHGKANDQSGDYSFLAFSEVKDSLENEWLYVREIYNLSLNADMVVLSACETGIGELKRGEGIISLARAFAYAGAKNIVSSLWSVDDARTKELMIGFYKNLLKGMTKDAALAEARRAYLKAHKGEHAHPWFWAGFVTIGDMGALKR